MIGYSYPASRTRTANHAFPMSPLITTPGPVYRFDLYYVAQLEEWGQLESIFPVMFDVNEGVASPAPARAEVIGA